MPHGTQVPRQQSLPHFAYGTFTPSGRPSQWRSAMQQVYHSAGPSRTGPRHGPTTHTPQRCKACTAYVWAPPLSLAATQGISVDFFSSRYLDGSVPWVSPPHPMCSDADDRYPNRPGYPIRPPPDHRMFAPPRGLSQLATAFFVG